MSTLAGSGTAAFVDGTGTSAAFSFPVDAAFDTGGNLYVGDSFNHRVRKVTPLGEVTTLAGSGSAAFAEGDGTAASFYYPEGVAVDSGGNVFVADKTNHRIRKVTPAGAVSTLAGGGTIAFADGVGTAASFNQPSGVAVDAVGNVYVADRDNHRIRKVTPGGAVSTLAGSGSAMFFDGTGTAASFKFPERVTVDSSGNVFVADKYNYRIRRVTHGGVVTTLAGTGLAAFGDGNGTSAAFNQPYGLAFDSSGNLLVADASNHRIRTVAPDGMVTTLAGNGVQGYSNSPFWAASFFFPTAVALDFSGNFFVVDAVNNRIRKFSCGLCPAGFYCPSGSMVSYPCEVGAYCPAGSAAPTPCPAGSPGLLVSAGSLAACYLQGGGSPSPPAATGSSCTSNSSCPSGACLGGYCCSPNAARHGCASCTPPLGDCRLSYPGDPCASNADCGTNLCLNRCCCSSAALQTLGCASCACWAAPSTVAATAGSCNSTAAAAAAITIALPCNASASLNASVALSRVISFPASANVSGAAPLVLLPAASPLNGYGVDIIVASPAACAAFAATAAASRCGAFSYALPGGTYFYLGAADALGMVAAPACGA